MARKKTNLTILIILVLFILVARQRGFLGAVNPPIEVPFSYKGYSGVGYYQTITSSDCSGETTFTSNVDEVGITVATSCGGQAEPWSVFGNFSVETADFKNLCVRGTMSRSNRDVSASGKLYYCYGECTTLFVIGPSGEDPGTWNLDRCYTFSVSGNALTIQERFPDGSLIDTNIVDITGFDNVQITGRVNGNFDEWDSASASMTLYELEPFSLACPTPGDGLDGSVCDGSVSRTELGQAITDWISGSLSRTDLGSAIQSWVDG